MLTLTHLSFLLFCLLGFHHVLTLLLQVIHSLVRNVGGLPLVDIPDFVNSLDHWVLSERQINFSAFNYSLVVFNSIIHIFGVVIAVSKLMGCLNLSCSWPL